MTKRRNKPKSFWRKRLNRLRKRVRAMEMQDTLLDLSVFCRMERETFIDKPATFLIGTDPGGSGFWTYKYTFKLDAMKTFFFIDDPINNSLTPDPELATDSDKEK